MRTRDGSEPRYLVVGKIVAPWGLRGEVKVVIETDFPERFERLNRVYLGEKAISCALEGSRLHKGHALLKLRGCDDRDAAEKLRGQLVQIPIEEAMPLDEDEYYVYKIVGLDVWTSEGEHLGRVSEVLFTGANDVYVVQGEKGEMLIPAVEDVVLEVDLAGGRLTVELMEGLI
jgi:16S rRNA processing protein RimM